MSFPKYPEYKDSGVEWLGEVPEDWATQRLKFIFAIKKRIAGAEGFDVLSITQQGIVVKDIEGNKGQFSDDYSKYQIVECGDFAMNGMDLLTGYVDLSIFYGVTSPDYRVFSLIDEATWDKNFLLRLLQNGYKQKIFYAFGQGASQLGRWRFPTQAFSNFIFPRPSKAEQSAIAAFLDHETAKIDALVAEQEKLIELLKEKRQAVISHAVTKGLDPNVPMKDSGDGWLGEVPIHWSILTFQRCVHVAEGQVDPEKEPYASMTLIAPNHVESSSGRILTLETAEEQGAESGKYLCQPSDVIYSKIRPALRKVCLSPGDCLCSADMYPLRPFGCLIQKFLFWFILSEQFSSQSVLESERVAMPKINRESLKAVRIGVPSLPEQESIVSHLESESSRIDALITESQSAIDLLKERRSALISAAVTGKIDVRGLAEATQ